MQPEFIDQQIFYSFLTGGLCPSSITTTTTTPTSSFCPFTIEEDTISKDKYLAARKNHKEAERRRRERINSHLNKLRDLLSCNSKTDKATLLAKVVQRVKELKQQTLEIISNETLLPSETDEVNVLECSNDDDNQIIFKVILCCEDRQDLMQDLVEILKSLRMETLFADMTTISGRTRNALVVVADKEQHGVESVQFLKNALKSLLERSSKSVLMGLGGGGGERSKRRRALDHFLMV